MKPQLNIDEFGRRADTYTSFLKPVEHSRKNLVIFRHAQAYQVLFNENKKAIGKMFLEYVDACSEVRRTQNGKNTKMRA